jgi:peptide-methionine (R)-S-oxide reductase
MNRRDFAVRLAALAGLPLLPAACARAKDPSGLGQIGRVPAYWRPLLRPEQYEILFNEGTERAGSSPLNHEKRTGTFICVACFLPLFSSKTKYDSGTGWPSFWQPLPDSVGTSPDHKLWVERTEYHCKRCGGHQGHVFDDGPPPTGLRYCNNGLALDFVPVDETLPALRG